MWLKMLQYSRKATILDTYHAASMPSFAIYCSYVTKYMLHALYYMHSSDIIIHSKGIHVHDSTNCITECFNSMYTYDYITQECKTLEGTACSIPL